MYRFECDYTETCHPAILQRLQETGLGQHPGYGKDVFCESAQKRIREHCGLSEEDCDIHFMVGGTQVNLTVISAILRPFQGVISADSGHIFVHEAGAIEATGHRVISVPSKDGKITAEQIRKIYTTYDNDDVKDQTVQPAMVYVSWPTETGLLYTKEELTAISATCRQLGLPLYLDGARLGYGLTSKVCDLTLEDIARLCDVFYIGGTKQGALLGEAVVFRNKALGRYFRDMMRNKGGLLAKGYLLGLQFDTLFKDDLYFQIAAWANQCAETLRQAFVRKGCAFCFPVQTNQLFLQLPNSWCEKLAKDFSFSVWERLDNGQSIIRFCTNWATEEQALNQLIQAVEAL